MTIPTIENEPLRDDVAAPRPSWWQRIDRSWFLLLIILVSTSATILATRRTSATFDEITTMTGGARGYHTGEWDMLHDFPPVMQYLYGLPTFVSGVTYPAEVRTDTVPHRYHYAQELLWKSGNDGERLIFQARLIAAACALMLILLTYFYASRAFGTGAGLLAAALIAFLPDVLAHGGIAYNDIALAPAFLAALAAVDAAVRTPSLARGLAAGALVSLALGIKHSALVLGPIAIVLLLIELAVRDDRRTWLPRALGTAAVALVAGYVVQVALYRGDFTLAYLRASTISATGHIAGGHGVPGFLLGQLSADAWWYFYPVVFLFKTPVAFHLLMLIALLGAVRAVQGDSLRAIMRGGARPYLIALVMYGAVLVRSNLVIGFRYALPLLPILCILTAAGAVVIWRTGGRGFRSAIVALALWSAGSALSFYPHFIAYSSEHQPDKDRAYEVYVDSSLDWGQGLIELRDFMRAENIPSVYLSYFGSALPEGYGINYVRLPSFFPLPPHPDGETETPRFAAISATNLVGLYFGTDPFRGLREREPYRVLGHTIFIYELTE